MICAVGCSLGDRRLKCAWSAIALLFLALFLTGCGSELGRERIAPTAPKSITLENGDTIGQTFVARFDGLAGCLRTPKGGSSRQTVLVIENGRVQSRLLSSREAARLMGAPEGFKLPSGYNDAYRAMGDAVAVPVVNWLLRHLLIPLAERARVACGNPTSPRAEIFGSRGKAESLAAGWRALATG